MKTDNQLKWMKFLKITFPLYFCFNNTAKKKDEKKLASGLTFYSGCSAQMKIFAFIGVGSFFKRHFERCAVIPKRCRFHITLSIEKKMVKIKVICVIQLSTWEYFFPH